jgi:hypothetical protein
MNQNEKQHIVELLCTSEPENIALAQAFCDSQNFPLETILREFGYWDVGIRCGADFSESRLNCAHLGLEKLPDLLPASLVVLYCFDNRLRTLPNLPIKLQWLYCGYNQLTALPPLPNSLTELNCFHNQLSNLPFLPKNLTSLNCYNNQLSALPELPSTLKWLYCYNNPLSISIDQIKQLAPESCIIRA